jgi:hypothetical protein
MPGAEYSTTFAQRKEPHVVDDDWGLSLGRFHRSRGGTGGRSALQWTRAMALAADGVSQRETASRLGINRRTVGRMLRGELRATALSPLGGGIEARPG